jgi:hypothetical protein
VLGLVTGSYSLALILTQIRGDTHHALLMLGIAEMAAAILFLIPRTMWFGGIGLMVVFAVAALFHVLHGDYNIGNLAVYAAAAFTVLCKPRQV